ncbi:SpoIIE family protein phosphatase [Streptomyces pacificus]|uniref:ANTAR domain-containing protein n=1 Tax=Streptomyces pacificus TaxID=2705029 RepID=A0A6A0B1L9_9ACTN|nr:SpoIIE family protein phosphatase [Streptomyces pacificus]GFH38164.1 ANTAR domain-containing protein [Streptomyces pacificus]
MTMPEQGPVEPEPDRLDEAVTRLTAELTALRRDAARRHLLDTAGGVLVAQHSFTPGEAADHLTRLAETMDARPEDLAADIVNGATGPPGASGDPPPEGDGGPVTGDDAARAGYGGVRSADRRARWAEAGAEAAAQLGGTADEIAATLLNGGMRPLGARALWLFLRTETDCLQLAGKAGVTPLETAHWHWVPPIAGSMLHRVLGEGTPLWLPGGTAPAEALPGPAPDSARAVLPLRQHGVVTGLALVDWPGPAVLDEHVRRALTGLAVPAARILDVGAPGTAGPGVLAPLLDLLTHPAMVLRADAKSGSLRIESLNRPALESVRHVHGPAGRSLAQVFPAMYGDLVRLAATARESAAPQRATRVPVEYRADGPDPLHDVRVLPVGPDRTVVLWHCATDPGLSLSRVLGRLENLAAFEDDLVTGESRWSEQAYRIFGLEPGTSPVPLRQLAPHLHQEDTGKLDELLTTLTRRRKGGHTVVRAVREDGGLRYLRIAAEPLLTGGVLSGITGVYQDVSAQHHTEIALSATFDRLTAAQAQAALRQQLVLQLQQAIVPEMPELRQLPGLQVAARYRPAAEEYRVGGDWYDVLPLPDGRVLVVTGDIAGHGIDSVTGMVALRNALRGLAFTGHPPGRLMAWLNEVTLHTYGCLTATAVCGLYDPGDHSLRWASAGHLPPVLLRRGAARLLEPPGSILLGAVPAVAYEERLTRLEPGDTLMLYTDGLVESRRTGIDQGLERLRRAVERLEPAGLDEQADALLAAVTSDTDDDTSLVVVRVS